MNRPTIMCRAAGGRAQSVYERWRARVLKHRRAVPELGSWALSVMLKQYPAVADPKLVGTYSASAKAGGGYVWDDVLEYRVWCHPERGAPDLCNGSDYYYAFPNCEEALAFSAETPGSEEPLALILQREYIDEPEPGQYVHVREERVAEWPIEFLRRPRRLPSTIPDFLSPTAPANRLEILRGLT